MEQRQSAGPKEDITRAVSDRPANDLFVFRPLTASPAPTPPSDKSTSDKSTSGRFSAASRLVGFRLAPSPDCVERPQPQEPLREQDAAYFRRLLTQYWTFPTNEEDTTTCVHFNLQAISIIYSLISKSKCEQITYGDLHQLEMALLHVMPEAVLRSEARLLRDHYRAIAPPDVFRRNARLKHTPENEAEGPVEELRAEMAALLSQTQHYWMRGNMRAEAHAAACQVSACWMLGLCVMGAVGFVLTHFLPILPPLVPAFPLAMALLGGAAAAFVYIRRARP